MSISRAKRRGVEIGMSISTRVEICLFGGARMAVGPNACGVLYHLGIPKNKNDMLLSLLFVCMLWQSMDKAVELLDLVKEHWKEKDSALGPKRWGVN